MEFFSLDLETTGLEPGRDEILEIAWVRFVDGRIRDRFQSLVRVERVPPAISSLTGIEPGDLADAPPLREVLPGVLEALAGRAVVAHNAPFDRAFLEAAAERLGSPSR
ncbi:3'-5' exonuclease [Candidatus Bipolaricaulota bacterium]|nr:3'-5' exonuclease [Candidatus Bipolaricaulota bacterium]